MTPAANPLVEQIRALIAEKRAAIDQLEAALVAVERAFGVVTVPAEATAAPTPRMPEQSVKRPARRATQGRVTKVPVERPKPQAPSRQRVDRSAVGATVRAFLAEATGPLTFAAIVQGCRVGKLHARTAIDALVQEGVVQRTGNRNSLRLTWVSPTTARTGRTSAKHAAATSSANGPSAVTAQLAIESGNARGLSEDEGHTADVRQVPSPRAGGEDLKLAAELNRVLKSGASYDLKELVRNIRGAFPDINPDRVTGALAPMIASAKVERIPLGSTTRYRRLATAS